MGRAVFGPPFFRFMGGEVTMGEQVILSISLLASNRKETVRKCIDSLRPIMEKVSSELIIVDTGCDGETRDILREYTDHIVPFRWCDDFSAARNAGLRQAKGEWFLYIDDDEWFTDVTEIVNFFQSGEYRGYGQAMYIQRNFQDREGTLWTDDWVSRMVRLTGDTRFVGIIHEYLAPVQGKCRYLKSPASHFGYVYDSAEEMYRHSKRNTALLLEMLGKEKDNPRWWTHLAQEYLATKEYYSLYDLCRKGIRHFGSAGSPGVNRQRGLFYVGCLWASLMRGLYGECIKDYGEAVRDSRNTELCRAALHIHGAVAYMRTKQYGKAAGCCREYLGACEKLLGDDTMIAAQGCLFMRNFFGKKDWNNACGILIICELEQGSDQALKQYFGGLGWEDDILYFNFDLIPALLDFWGRAEYDGFYVRAAELLLKREDVSVETIRCLQEREKTLPGDAFLRLARIFSRVDTDICYIIYLRILYKDSCGESQGLQDDLEALLERQGDFLCLPDRLWDIAERSGADLEGLFSRMEFDHWKAGVDIFVQGADIDTILRRQETWFGPEVQSSPDSRSDLEAQGGQDLQTEPEAQSSPDLQPGSGTAAVLRRDYFLIRAKEALLVKGHYSNSYEGLYQALLGYVDGSLKLYGAFFNDNAFSGEMEFLPLSCRLAVRLGTALMQEKDGGYIAALEAYKDCLKVYPAMDGVVRQYVHLYKEKTEAEIKELARLKEQLKGRVRELIDNQEYEKAGLISTEPHPP